jgi:hypothetical protein
MNMLLYHGDRGHEEGHQLLGVHVLPQLVEPNDLLARDGDLLLDEAPRFLLGPLLAQSVDEDLAEGVHSRGDLRNGRPVALKALPPHGLQLRELILRRAPQLGARGIAKTLEPLNHERIQERELAAEAQQLAVI